MLWECINISGIDMDATRKKICQMIDESNFTDKELGKMMGLSVQAINKWRHGHNLPDIENLFLLSRILGVRVDDFLVPLIIVPFFEIDTGDEKRGEPVEAIHYLWLYFIKLDGISH